MKRLRKAQYAVEWAAVLWDGSFAPQYGFDPYE